MRNRKRNRERSDKRTVLRAEWWYRGRGVVLVEVMRRGDVLVTAKVPAFRVDRVSRELAAEWLREYMPRLTHDERYAILWEQ